MESQAAPIVETAEPAAEPEAPTLPRALAAIVEQNRQMAERLQALEQRTNDDAAEITKMRNAARDRALDEVGLLPEYRAAVPENIDASTPDGRKALDEWVAARPAMVRPPVKPEVKPSDLLPADAAGSWLNMPADALRDWVARSADYRRNGRRVQ